MKIKNFTTIMCMLFLSTSCSKYQEIATYDLKPGLKIKFSGDKYWDRSSPIHFVIYDEGREVLISRIVDYYVPSSEPSPNFQFYWNQNKSVIGIAQSDSPVDLIAVVDSNNWTYHTPWSHEAPRKIVREMVDSLRLTHPKIKPFP